VSYSKNLFNNIGFLMADLPKDIFDAVKAGCDDYRVSVSGNILKKIVD